MKTIVVSGARSGIGKSTLVKEIGLLLDGLCKCVKIGHGTPKKEIHNLFYPWGTSFSAIEKDHSDIPFLIIESNSICKELKPDLLIYLDSENRKPSAEFPQTTADIKSGTLVQPSDLERLATTLNLPISTIQKIAWLAGARPETVQGVILGGGMSSRMGRDKASLPIGDSTLLSNMIKTLRPLCDSVSVSTQQGKTIPIEDVLIVEDQEYGKGPLMGIYSVLCKSTHRICIVTACDIPYIYKPLINKMLCHSDEYDIIVPSFSNGTVEPLLAIYTKGCIDTINNHLINNRLRITDVLTHCKTKIIEENNGSWYANLNTPIEYDSYVKSNSGKQS